MPSLAADPLEKGVRDATFAPADRRILADYWHPVAFSEQVKESGPFAAKLLDVDVVLYRLKGVIHAALDVCPHRGARLSLGWTTPDRLACVYHGLEFDSRGRCVRIPSDTEGAVISERLQMTMIAVEERFGLVWLCLSGSPRAPIPDWSGLEQAGNQRGSLHGVWKASALRHLENFCDLAHLSFVHAKTFAVPGREGVAPYVVERRPHGLYFQVLLPMLDEQTLGSEVVYVEVLNEFEITYPFAARLTLHFPRGVEHICDVVSPTTSGSSQFFMLKSRDHDQDTPLENWVGFQEIVNEEDRALVESQTPDWPAFPKSGEIHVGSDRFSVAYRKHWFDQGLGRSD
jgi:vanillate O-demethylase monooxygenase subunit